MNQSPPEAPVTPLEAPGSPPVRPAGEPITNFGAAAVVFILFFLALAMMSAVVSGRG